MDSVQRPFSYIHNRLRQPDYTGENRCRPCTILNSIIAVVLTGIVALISIPLAAAVLAISVATIVFRGYLVPGTPTLVQYLPDAVHDAIGSEHGPDGEASLDDGGEPTFNAAEMLERAEVIEECADVDDLCLSEAFQQQWHQQMRELRNTDRQRDALAETLEVSAETIRFEETNAGWFVFVDDIRAGRWSSRAAFIADLASEVLLETHLGHWEELPAHDRARTLASLRAFIEECPSCGGEVSGDERVIASCCRGDTVTVETACADCGSVIFEGTQS